MVSVLLIVTQTGCEFEVAGMMVSILFIAERIGCEFEVGGVMLSVLLIAEQIGCEFEVGGVMVSVLLIAEQIGCEFEELIAGNTELDTNCLFYIFRASLHVLRDTQVDIIFKFQVFSIVHSVNLHCTRKQWT